MKRFAKRQTCPPSQQLEAYRDQALAPAEINRVASHLAACDFCSAELRLLSAAALSEESTNAAASVAPPVPLALRLFAESQLETAALRSSLRCLRAA